MEPILPNPENPEEKEKIEYEEEKDLDFFEKFRQWFAEQRQDNVEDEVESDKAEVEESEIEPEYIPGETYTPEEYSQPTIPVNTVVSSPTPTSTQASPQPPRPPQSPSPPQTPTTTQPQTPPQPSSPQSTPTIPNNPNIAPQPTSQSVDIDMGGLSPIENELNRPVEKRNRSKDIAAGALVGGVATGIWQRRKRKKLERKLTGEIKKRDEKIDKLENKVEALETSEHKTEAISQPIPSPEIPEPKQEAQPQVRQVEQVVENQPQVEQAPIRQPSPENIPEPTPERVTTPDMSTPERMTPKEPDTHISPSDPVQQRIQQLSSITDQEDFTPDKIRKRLSSYQKGQSPPLSSTWKAAILVLCIMAIIIFIFLIAN